MAGALWPWLVSGVLGFAVGGGLLWRSRRPVDVGLAVLLLGRGLMDVAQAARLVEDAPRLAHDLVPLLYVVLPWAVAALLVLHRAAAREGTADTRVLAGLGVGAAASVVWLQWSPPAWVAATSDGGFAFGPLFAATGLLHVLYSVLALVFVWEHRHEVDATQRRGLALVALGLSFFSTFVATVEWWRIGLAGSGGDGWFQVAHVLLLLSVAPVVGVLGLLATTAASSQDEAVKRDLARFLLVFLLPAINVGILALFEWAGEETASMAQGMEGFWSMMAPAMVALGLRVAPGQSLSGALEDQPDDAAGLSAEQLDEQRRRAEYRDAVASARVDGIISDADRRDLEQLRLRLRLHRTITDAIEKEAS